MYTCNTYNIKIALCKQIFRKSIQETTNIAYLLGIDKGRFPLITFNTLLNYLALPQGGIITFTMVMMTLYVTGY